MAIGKRFEGRNHGDRCAGTVRCGLLFSQKYFLRVCRRSQRECFASETVKVWRRPPHQQSRSHGRHQCILVQSGGFNCFQGKIPWWVRPLLRQLLEVPPVLCWQTSYYLCIGSQMGMGSCHQRGWMSKSCRPTRQETRDWASSTGLVKESVSIPTLSDPAMPMATLL